MKKRHVSGIRTHPKHAQIKPILSPFPHFPPPSILAFVAVVVAGVLLLSTGAAARASA